MRLLKILAIVNAVTVLILSGNIDIGLLPESPLMILPIIGVWVSVGWFLYAESQKDKPKEGKHGTVL